jgi:hypothetical protein
MIIFIYVVIDIILRLLRDSPYQHTHDPDHDCPPPRTNAWEREMLGRNSTHPPLARTHQVTRLYTPQQKRKLSMRCTNRVVQAHDNAPSAPLPPSLPPQHLTSRTREEARSCVRAARAAPRRDSSRCAHTTRAARHGCCGPAPDPRRRSARGRGRGAARGRSRACPAAAS